MLREHARACRDETAALGSELAPVFGTGAATRSETMPAPGVRMEEVEAVVGELLALATKQDEAIRSAFALPTGETTPAVSLRQTGFWDVIHRIETLAARLGGAD